MKVMHVVGARPNFPKTAAIMDAMAGCDGEFQQVLVHTGQHYDDNMSRVFFEELTLPKPDAYLGVGSGSHAQQTADIMCRFEPVLLAHRPDWLVVVGDVNSTLAAALVASKLGVPVAHVEAGLRSRDRTMPEEINRLLTDRLADLLLTPSVDADQNLLAEGMDPDAIHRVGNVMIDTLVRMLPAAASRPVLERFGLVPRAYVLVTLHRPSNVDESERLSGILTALNEIGRQLPVLFPVHPRTRSRIPHEAATEFGAGLRLVEPLGYVDFLALMRQARLVLTDSGGVQEETTYLGVPCLTARPRTERPITIDQGTNRLVSSRYEPLLAALRERLDEAPHGGRVPELWDGKASTRIVEVFRRLRV
jgi:UDP-N-acetylglucosamine 2-epimerase (non-hydrolysing)